MNVKAAQKTGQSLQQVDIRCRCGSLVARRIGESIELKCRRCKRLAHISLSQLANNPDGLEVRF